MHLEEIDTFLEKKDVVVNEIGEILDSPMVQELFNAAAKEDGAAYSMYHLLKEIDKTVNDLQMGGFFSIAFAVKHGHIQRERDLQILLKAGVEYDRIYIYEARYTISGNLIQCLNACDGAVAKLYLAEFFDENGNQKTMTEDERGKAYINLHKNMKKEH